MKLNNTQKEFLRNIGLHLLPKIFDVLCKSVRIEFENEDAFLTKIKEHNIVLAFWHGKMAIGWYLLKNKNAAAIVSRSRDGDLLSELLKHWNYKLARGSSSKGGKDAMELLLNFARQKMNIAITPDGPKGPERKMKAGAVITAKKSGVPLILAGIGYSNYWQLKSWDKMKIPKPFSKAKVIFSDPIFIDANLSYDDTSKLIELYEKELNKLDKQAEEIDRHN